MPRRVQDIVPGNHRSIRDIPVEHISEDRHVSTAHARKVPHLKKTEDTEVSKHPATQANHKMDVHRQPIEPSAMTHRSKRSSNGRWILLTLAIIIVVAGIGFVASTYFSRATFTIVPKTIPVSVNGTYVAQYASQSATGASPDVLTYETTIIHRSLSATIPASNGPSISTKAIGKVNIYNSYSTESQQLIAGTRLSNSSGKVYRLTGTVTVPGKSANDTPGSIIVAVVADQSGQIYNLSKSSKIDDFRLLGYKGTPRYDGFSAKLATDISGGYEGKKKTVSPSILASTSASLKAQLSLDLAASAAKEIPEGYITYESLNTISFGDAVISGTDPTKAEISISAVFNGVMFKKDRLASRLAGAQAISSFGKFGYDTPGLEKLSMTISNSKDFAPEKKTPLLVRGTGSFNVVGVIPSDEIRKKLAGVALSSTQEILQIYGPIIQSATGELIPPWAKVPSDPDRISVVVKEK